MALTDRQIKKQWFYTNGCFRHALLKHYDQILTKKEKRYNLAQLKLSLTKKDIPINSPEVNELYLQNILALTTKKLNLILEAAAHCRRKQETIDAITTELFERSANSETRENHES